MSAIDFEMDIERIPARRATGSSSPQRQVPSLPQVEEQEANQWTKEIDRKA